jgi:hypothetical protein
MTYGANTSPPGSQAKELQIGQADPGPVVVTTDTDIKVDGYPFLFGGNEYIAAGINDTGNSRTYMRTPGSQYYVDVQDIATGSNDGTRNDGTELTRPWLAQAHKSIIEGQLLFTAYEAHDFSTDFAKVTWAMPGEIWLTTQPPMGPKQQWRISASQATLGPVAKYEPKPLLGRSKVRVFYSSLPEGAGIDSVPVQLRRADTPISRDGGDGQKGGASASGD